jgi:hypothetical protein
VKSPLIEARSIVMPLGDEQPTQIVPAVNCAIIALNVLVFFVQQSRPESFTIGRLPVPLIQPHALLALG